ncbi:TLC domain-containing protein 5 isoform X2 [Brassica napus]|uniref:TLC domain-containing protein 5 isoform X2 n=1 Tax=Brassica napus TaxID=3708 RepID=UPI0006AA959F|nr:TLC domain-containing protein 5 isoform X2 [Brassica napus]
MEEEYIRVINITVIGVISWGLIFILVRRIFSNYSFDFSTRIVSTLHATVAVVLATLTIQDCHFDQVLSIDNAVHHSVCILGFVAGLCYRKCASEMVAAIWITEISSPVLHLREILKEIGYRDTDLNLAADVCFATIFSLARMVGGPYLVYVTMAADNPILIKAMALGLQLVSAFWFYKILKMMRYKIMRRSMPNTKSD